MMDHAALLSGVRSYGYTLILLPSCGTLIGGCRLLQPGRYSDESLPVG